MADVSRRGGEGSPKFIHSNLCFVAVPLGLCALAAAVNWLASVAQGW